MYKSAFGIIETLAPLHVGASAGEETGNLNLIFRDQFTQTGLVPGSSIRGRFRADMRGKRQDWLETELEARGVALPDPFSVHIHPHKPSKENGDPNEISRLKWLEITAQPLKTAENPLDLPADYPVDYNEHRWYGHEAVEGRDDGGTTEALVKFEYASLLWLPVFCPGQPVVWVSSPRLIERYKLMNPDLVETLPDAWRTEPVPAYTAATTLQGKILPGEGDNPDRKLLFFNLGYLELSNLVSEADMATLKPLGSRLQAKNMVIVHDSDIGMIHDMALFRQTRVKLADSEKKVAGGAFFNVEALPEGSYLAFPIALKHKDWKPFSSETNLKG